MQRSDITTRSAIAKRPASGALTIAREPGLRFVVSIDATASRESTWRGAQAITGELFELMRSAGVPLSVRLVHFGGGYFTAREWTDDITALQGYMRGVECRLGGTQMRDVLEDAFTQAVRGPVAGVIHIGDAIEERPRELRELACQLKAVGVPVFMFRERQFIAMGRGLFKEIASITGGAYSTFEPGAFRDLAGLLKVAMASRTRDADLLGRLRLGGTLPPPARLLLADLSGRS